MKVNVTEYAVVEVEGVPSRRIGYKPGVHTAPRHHIDQIVAQGRGERITPPKEQPETKDETNAD